MQEIPILFNGPMAKAVLDGRKTVTRRLVKGGQIPHLSPIESEWPWTAVAQYDPRYGFVVSARTEQECAELLGIHGESPYGRPGDRLWGREAWAADQQLDGVAPRDMSHGEPIVYLADNALRQTGCAMITKGKTRPSIHMPRWASRIELEVTERRIERLQAITEDQAIAEGLVVTGEVNGRVLYSASTPAPIPAGTQQVFTPSGTDAISAFRQLWESTGGDWASNPWVWVVEFKRVEAASGRVAA
ncbi:hypothetical protein [Pseudomonas sp. Irchel 3E13]|uniref:hypothetical protein n=1 Tax=Pseudomonas sp. Irchel 3E13 TaxID=2008975 RepID=UPI000BA3BE89|nr:hypothetical protein [Pseudomonas sp. Irchel 3E13]